LHTKVAISAIAPAWHIDVRSSRRKHGFNDIDTIDTLPIDAPSCRRWLYVRQRCRCRHRWFVLPLALGSRFGPKGSIRHREGREVVACSALTAAAASIIVTIVAPAITSTTATTSAAPAATAAATVAAVATAAAVAVAERQQCD
jgi:hypothetical protein